MDFTIPSAVENYRARIAAFVERELILSRRIRTPMTRTRTSASIS